jgi:hypothetical protein
MNNEMENSELNNEVEYDLTNDSKVDSNYVAAIDNAQKQAVDDTESNKLNMKKQEMLKREKVKEAILENKVFKNMQAGINKHANLNIDVENVVDIYFSLTSDVNTYGNLEYYKANDEIVSQAVGQFNKVLTQEPNGIAFNPDGTWDKKTALEQEINAAYSSALREKLDNIAQAETYNWTTNDDKSKQKQNQTNDKNIYKSYTTVDYSKASDLLERILTSPEAGKPRTAEEYKSLAKKIHDDENVKASIEEHSQKTFISNKEEFNLIYYSTMYARELQKETPDFNIMAEFLEKIRTNDKNGDFVNSEDNSINSAKVVAYSNEFYEDYTRKRNYKSLENFYNVNTKFEDLSGKNQRRILKSIYSLYRQEPSNERIFALTMLMQISPDIVTCSRKDFEVDENKFLNLYNSTLSKEGEGQKIDLIELNKKVDERNLRIEDGFFKGIQKLIDKNQFEEIRPLDNLNDEERKEFTKKAMSEIRAQNRPKINATSKQKFHWEIEKIMKKNDFEDDKAALLVGAYHLAMDKGLPYKKSKEMLKNYIEGNPEIFGEYLEEGVVTGKTLKQEDDRNEDIDNLLDSIVEYNDLQKYIEDNKFCKEAIKDRFSDLGHYVKDGAKFIGKSGRQWFNRVFAPRNIPQLGEGQGTNFKANVIDKIQNEDLLEDIRSQIDDEQEQATIKAEGIELYNSQKEEIANDFEASLDKSNPWEVSDEIKRKTDIVAQQIATNGDKIISSEQLENAQLKRKGIEEGKIISEEVFMEKAEKSAQVAGGER